MPSRRLELVGIREIQAMFGYAYDTVYRMRTRGTLPAQEWLVSGSPIWRRSTIERWAQDTGRLTLAQKAAQPMKMPRSARTTPKGTPKKLAG